MKVTIEEKQPGVFEVKFGKQIVIAYGTTAMEAAHKRFIAQKS